MSDLTATADHRRPHTRWGWFVALGIAQLVLGAIAWFDVIAFTIFGVIFIGALLVVAGLLLLPLAVALNASLKPEGDIVRSLELPTTLYLDNYRSAWAILDRPLLNSLLITVPAVFLSVFVGCLAAYPLSMRRIRFSRTCGQKGRNACCAFST